MSELTKNITCPSCGTTTSYDKWYEVSNDYQAVCPECSGVIGYDEFEIETNLSNIR